ncbi:MAG: two-component system LytT family response regulator [Myxococcota bacterium]|jgi:two-component system LytT family response regulator
MIDALVVDDEPRARARLRRLLADHPDVVVVGEAATGDDAVRQVLHLRPHLVFLDVQMPGGTGLEAAERLRACLPEPLRPHVVFTTAHAEHAVQAFALESMDYLLKPVERARLDEALRRVRRAVYSGEATPVRPVEPAFVTGLHGTSREPVPLAGVTHVEVVDGTVFASEMDGQRRRLSESLAELEARLPVGAWVRVSRGAMVQLRHVERLRPADSGTWEAEMMGGSRLKVSRRRSRRLRQLLGDQG